MAELTLEKGMLGRIIVNPNMLVEALDNGLKEEYFLEKKNRDLFKKMINIYETEGIFDLSFLKLSLEEQIKLGEHSDQVIYIPSSVKALREEYRNYKLDTETWNIVNSEMSSEEKVKKLRDVTENLESFDNEKNITYAPKDLSDSWWKSLENKEIDGIWTSYKDLDEYFSLQAGNLITVGARPSMGKTAFGINLAYRNSVKHDVLYVNLEMTINEITNIILASMSSVPAWNISKKRVNEAESLRVAKYLETFEKLNLQVMDCTDNNFNKIVQDIKKLYEKYPFKLIVIDYLTLMQARGHANKNLEVEYMANRLKLLAKELGTCLVLLAQLNRSIETRGDRRPTMSDIRDSGGVEQASNIICMLYRDDYYTKEEKEISSLEILIRKNRGGRIGDVTLAFKKETQSIRNAEIQYKTDDREYSESEN